MTPRTGQRFTPPPAEDTRRPRGLPMDLGSPAAPVVLGLAALGMNSVFSGTAACAVQPVVSTVDDPVFAQNDAAAPGGSSTGTPSPFWSSQEASPDAAGRTDQLDAGSPGRAPTGSPTDPTAPPTGSTFPSPPAHETATGAGNNRVVEGTVTVRGGESLWSITADLLGPQATAAEVAAAWPALWTTNAGQVPDPDVLQAGTVLTVPDSLHPASDTPTQ